MAIQQSHALNISLISATLAVISDLTMLITANATNPSLIWIGLPKPSFIILWFGGVLGMLAIPVMMIGYHALSEKIRPLSTVAGQILFFCGIGIGIFGALFHGTTALSIKNALHAGTMIQAPAIEAISHSQLSFAIYILTSLCLLTASLIIFVFRCHILPAALCWLNPITITCALAIIAQPWEVGRAFLLPSAPNLAHVLFFASLLYQARHNQT